MPSRARRGDPHGWNTLERYLHIHARHMDLLQASGFVVEDGLEFELRDDPPVLIIWGRLRCLHGLFVDVRKTLAVQDRQRRIMVRTIDYAYHAGIEGAKDRPIFRYDNAHTYPGHPDAHHKHRFDPATWRQIGRPDWVGAAGWPHLSDAVEELRDWWNETGQQLGLRSDSEGNASNTPPGSG